MGDPIGDDGVILLILNITDEDTIRATLARDPWTQMGHLDEPRIRRWTTFLKQGVRG